MDGHASWYDETKESIYSDLVSDINDYITSIEAIAQDDPSIWPPTTNDYLEEIVARIFWTVRHDLHLEFRKEEK